MKPATSICCLAGAIALLGGGVAFALSWLLIDPHLEDAATYPGGLVLRDGAGKVLRVSLGADDWDAMLFPSFTLRAVCIPWLEAGDLITVWADDNTKVQSWALQQSISGINVLRQSVTASAGMTAEVDDGD